MEGIVSYDLFLEVHYCPDDSFNPTGKCSSNVTGFTPVDKCHHVENDSSSSTGKVFQCTVCNNSKKCESWGLFSMGKVICAYLEVTTLNGTVCSSCSCRGYSDILIILPAKSLQLLPVSQRELTVLWERPEEIESPILTYILILRDHLGKCQGNIEDVDDQVQGNQKRNTYSFTNLMPWSSYSVIVCSFLLGGNLVNETTCTCGDHHHQPKGPVFNKTLPEEPIERPDVQLCQAQCNETNFTVTLKWKARNMLVWNGIPEKSVIRIYQRNSSSQSLEEMYQNTSHNIENLIKTVHVPLEPNYNGSLMRYSVSNLNSKQTYFSEVQLCSNGGCGPPSAMAVLSCNYCELLRPLSTEVSTTEAHHNSEDNSTYWAAIIGVFSVLFLVVSGITVCIMKRKSRNRSRTLSLWENIGPLPHTHEYEDLESTDRASDGGPYSELFSSET